MGSLRVGRGRGKEKEGEGEGGPGKRGVQHFLQVPVCRRMAISADPSSPSCLNDNRAVRCSPLAAINSSRTACFNHRFEVSLPGHRGLWFPLSTQPQLTKEIRFASREFQHRWFQRRRVRHRGGMAWHGAGLQFTHPIPRDNPLWVGAREGLNVFGDAARDHALHVLVDEHISGRLLRRRQLGLSLLREETLSSFVRGGEEGREPTRAGLAVGGRRVAHLCS